MLLPCKRCFFGRYNCNDNGFIASDLVDPVVAGLQGPVSVVPMQASLLFWPFHLQCNRGEDSFANMPDGDDEQQWFWKCHAALISFDNLIFACLYSGWVLLGIKAKTVNSRRSSMFRYYSELQRLDFNLYWIRMSYGPVELKASLH